MLRSGTRMVKTSKIGLIRREARVLMCLCEQRRTFRDSNEVGESLRESPIHGETRSTGVRGRCSPPRTVDEDRVLKKKLSSGSQWPAAAVIPAPIAYIKVVAVKTLVVGLRSAPTGPASFAVVLVGVRLLCRDAAVLGPLLALAPINCGPVFYCEERKVFKAGQRLEFVSME